MADPLKIGIIGLGKMGGTRFRELQRRADVKVCTGSDVNADLYSLYPGVSCSDDYLKVLDSEVDAVFVCTPNRFTADIVCDALDAGKHVFAEKPPGRSPEDVTRIMEAERRNPQLKLKFGFNHRYHAGIQEAKRIIDSNRLGKLLWARSAYGKSGGVGFENEWRSSREMCGGGILLDQGIHMLDLLRFFFGDFPEVKSMVVTAHWPIEVEDNAFALLRDSQGRIATIHSSSTQWKHRFQLELYTTDGFLSVNGILSSTRSYGDESITIARKGLEDATALGKPREEIVYFDTDPSWELEIGEFIDAILNDRPISYGTSEDALAAMDLVFRIYEADPSWAGGSDAGQGGTGSK